MPTFSQGVHPTGFQPVFADYITTALAVAPSASSQVVGDDLRDAVKNLRANQPLVGLVNHPDRSTYPSPGGLIFQFLGTGAANDEITARIEGWSVYGKNTLKPATEPSEINQVLLVPTLYWSGGLALASNQLRPGVRFADDIVVAPTPVVYADGTSLGNDDLDPTVWDPASGTDFATIYIKDAYFYFDFYTVTLGVLSGGGGAAGSANCLVRKVQ